MARYKKILAWAGPLLIPVLAAGLRRYLGRKRPSKDPGQEDGVSLQETMVETLVDAGLQGLSRTLRR